MCSIMDPETSLSSETDQPINPTTNTAEEPTNPTANTAEEPINPTTNAAEEPTTTTTVLEEVTTSPKNDTVSTTEPVDTTCCSPWLSCSKYSNNVDTASRQVIVNNLDETVHGPDTIINTNISPVEFDWQAEFFKKFEWLKENTTFDTIDEEGLATSTATAISPLTKRQQMFEKACTILEEFLEAQQPQSTQPVDLEHPEFSKLYLYFVALEQNRMILHASFKRTNDDIIKDCARLYEFARVYPPTKIVYILDNVDFYDVDKYVKMFMNLFGIDETRGGAYTDVVLPDYMKQTLERELAVATVDHFVNQYRQLSEE